MIIAVAVYIRYSCNIPEVIAISGFKFRFNANNEQFFKSVVHNKSSSQICDQFVKVCLVEKIAGRYHGTDDIGICPSSVAGFAGL